MAVSIEFDDEAARAGLARLAGGMHDMSKPMGVIARTLEQLTRQSFRDEADPWGTPWAGHSPVTLRMRRARGQASVQRLLDSGAMYSTIRGEHSQTDASVSVGGTGGAPAPVHQFGNPSNRMFGRGLAPIPARPFLPIRPAGDADLPASWSDEVLNVLALHMQEAA